MTLSFGVVGVAALLAGGGVQPVAGQAVVGPIAFHRPQGMEIDVAANDKLAFKLGFDGACRGDGLGELWMAYVRADKLLPVHGGRFSGRLTGSQALSGGRTAHFKWTVSGRFTAQHVATATVSGTATMHRGGRIVSRCAIAKPATAKLRKPKS
jgi:hypothetical protein